MKCKQCGAEIKNDEKFCRVCGARLPAEAAASEPTPPPAEPVKPSAEKPEKKQKKSSEKPQKAPKPEKTPRKLPKKPLLIAIAAAVVIVAVLVLILFLRGGSSRTLSLNADRAFAVDSLATYRVVVYDSTGAPITSIDGAATAVSSVWGDTTVIFGADSATFVFGGVASSVDRPIVDLVLSADGSTAAYIEVASGAADGDLWLYDLETAESELVCSNAVAGTLVLSADGSQLAYNIFDEASDAEHTMVGKAGSSAARLLDCERMLAISNDGETRYFENDHKLYFERSGERTRIAEPYEFVAPLMLSSDGAEALYSTDRGSFYLSKEASEPVKISDETLVGALGYLDELRDGEVGYLDRLHEGEVETMRLSTFADALILCGGEIYDLSNGVQKLADCESAVASESGKKLAYIDAGGYICFSSGSALETELKRVRPDQHPTALFADPELKRIYFTNDRGELWRLNGEKTEMVSADTSSFKQSGAGELYFLYDGVVLCRADGSERVSVGRMGSSIDIVSVPKGVIVRGRHGEMLYFVDGSTESRMLSGASVSAE